MIWSGIGVGLVLAENEIKKFNACCSITSAATIRKYWVWKYLTKNNVSALVLKIQIQKFPFILATRWMWTWKSRAESMFTVALLNEVQNDERCFTNQTVWNQARSVPTVPCFSRRLKICVHLFKFSCRIRWCCFNFYYSKRLEGRGVVFTQYVYLQHISYNRKDKMLCQVRNNAFRRCQITWSHRSKNSRDDT